MPLAFHHVELWTDDLDEAAPAWDWLLTAIGWGPGPQFANARSWDHPGGPYLVVEQSPDVTSGGHDRMRPGLNHLAVECADRATLDAVRSGAAAHGWRELFADRYPHAGGEQHTALYLENTQGFEVEVVVAEQSE